MNFHCKTTLHFTFRGEQLKIQKFVKAKTNSDLRLPRILVFSAV
ncbi:hypothetical protein CKA32_001105 [Geitlerinema sp. FC II]|nr:hypothetical protein CKA32_001105 [Geitlerinema sp. FC II]